MNGLTATAFQILYYFSAEVRKWEKYFNYKMNSLWIYLAEFKSKYLLGAFWLLLLLFQKLC